MNLVLILFIIILVGIIILLVYKNHNKKVRPTPSTTAELRSVFGDNFVEIFSVIKNPNLRQNLLNGIINLEPNSEILLTFNDFSVGFKANNNGEVYFNPNKDVIPLNCLPFNDFRIYVSPLSANTANVLLTPVIEDCDSGTIYQDSDSVYRIIDIPIVPRDNSNKILKIIIDRFGASVGFSD